MSSFKKYGKVLAIAMSALVLFLLIASVPAKAFVLNFDVKNNNVEKGQKVIFDVSIDINANENLPITKLVLQLTGKSNKTCEFSVDGIILSGCNGMTISPFINSSQSSGYGYGYGYGTGTGYTVGTLSYRITLDTMNYETGDYQTKITAYIGNTTYSQTGETVTINAGSSDGYEPDGVQTLGKVCLNGWTCSAWSDCIDGKQTRICELLPNCYFESRPAEERICIESNKTNGLRLVSSYETLKLGRNTAGEESSEVSGRILMGNLNNLSNKELVIIAFILMVLIIVLLILILLAILAKRIGRRRRIIGRRRQLNNIRYNPVR